MAELIKNMKNKLQWSEEGLDADIHLDSLRATLKKVPN